MIIGMAMYSAERLSGTLVSAALFEHLMLCKQAVNKSADAYPCACGQRPASGVPAAGKPAARGSEQAGPECRRSWRRPAEPGAPSLPKIRTSSALYSDRKRLHQAIKHHVVKRTLASYGGICSPTAASSACIGAVGQNRLCCHAVCDHLPV